MEIEMRDAAERIQPSYVFVALLTYWIMILAVNPPMSLHFSVF